MYPKRLFILLLYNISFVLYGQNPENFTGHWTYETVVVGAQKDSTKYKLVDNLYNDLHIHFKEDGDYSSFILNRNENGQWTFLDNTLELRSSQGAIIEMKIIDVSDDVLTLQFANETFKLKKSKNYPLTFSTTEQVHSDSTDYEKPKKKRKRRHKRKADKKL